MTPGTATDPSIWTVLLPVLIGGLLPLLGIAVGPMISQWLEGRANTASVRVQRFEELLDILQRQEEWTNLLRSVNAYGEDHEIPTEPLHKAYAIAALHFPQFLMDLRQLDAATRAYSHWTSEAALRRLEGNISGIGDGFPEVANPFLTKLHELQHKLIDYAVAQKGRI